MDHLAVALLIPVAVIVMGGLTQIAREFARGRRRPDITSLEAQMEGLEHELRSVRRDLGETLQEAGSWPRQLFGLSAKKRCDAPDKATTPSLPTRGDGGLAETVLVDERGFCRISGGAG